MDAADRAATICPTGSLVVKHIGYSLPFGGRMYDLRPIGSDVEQGAAGRYEPQGR